MAGLLTLGQILLKKGASKFTGYQFANVIDFIFLLLKNGYVWITLIVYGLAFALWFFINSRTDVSFAFPFVTASVLILVILLSHFIFGEEITIIKAAATFLILSGILLLAWK